jgi:2-polyprenyl-6-methoxyphenol hydroxylase-like FAD-dependent oxidoreductase
MYQKRRVNESNAVMVIGGGVAGPAMAIALARAGMASVVYEASAAPRDAEGLFLNVAPNGLNVLRALGADGVIDRLGFVNDWIAFENHTGKLLARDNIGAVTLMRGELSRALRTAAEDLGVRFEFGKTVESIRESSDQVVAQFTDGTFAHGRLLIGADGIHSRVRASVFPGSPPPSYTGIINVGGITRTDLPSTGATMCMVFGRRSFFGYAVRPSGDTYWFANYAQAVVPGRTAFRVPADVMRPELTELFGGDHAVVSRILDSVRGDIEAYAIYDLDPIPSWHRGRVCLIGDAAHAMGPHVGQGVSLAFEDAFVLAKCLRDIPFAHGAFEAFERLRRPRVDPILHRSRHTGRQKAPAGPVGRLIRDLLLPFFIRRGGAQIREVYKYPFDWDAPLALDAP